MIKRILIVTTMMIFGLATQASAGACEGMEVFEVHVQPSTDRLGAHFRVPLSGGTTLQRFVILCDLVTDPLCKSVQSTLTVALVSKLEVTVGNLAGGPQTCDEWETTIVNWANISSYLQYIRLTDIAIGD